MRIAEPAKMGAWGPARAATASTTGCRKGMTYSSGRRTGGAGRGVSAVSIRTTDAS